MTIVSVAQAAHRLGIDAKTLRRWFAEAQLPLQRHPHDGREKRVSGEHLQVLAHLHHRSLTPLSPEPPAPVPSQVPPLPIALLALPETLGALQAEIPGLGGTVAFDVKHLYAWVRENTPQVYVKGSKNVSYICQGDPDCRLGVKKSSKQASDDTSDHQPADASKTRTHQEQAHGSKTKSTKKKQVSLFGYGTGVAACTDPVSGDSVLAECTLPRERSRCDLFSSPLRPHAGGPQAVSPLYCR